MVGMGKQPNYGTSEYTEDNTKAKEEKFIFVLKEPFHLSLKMLYSYKIRK